MSTLLLTEQPDGPFVTGRRSGAPTRFFTRLRRWALDKALADGASPDSSAALSLRAHKLISQSTRRRLSREIRDLQREAERGARLLSPGIPICRAKIVGARPALDELRTHLLSPGPVSVAGVAQVQVLLRDGASPLYHRSQADDLELALQATIEALEVRV